MKKFLFHLAITINLLPIFLFLKTPHINAQSCGDACGVGSVCTAPYTCVNGACTSSPTCPPCTISGVGNGACEVPMACSSGTQGVGNCGALTPLNPSDICCVPPPLCPAGGSIDCGGNCTTSADCMSGLQCNTTTGQCYGTICTTGQYCPMCTGTSGYSGVCINSTVCNGIGKNSTDGSCSNPSGTVCCTEAPTGTSCQLFPTPPYVPNAYFNVVIQSNTPNGTYNFTTTPSTCLVGQRTVDASGNGSVSIICSATGTYTITATKTTSPATSCSTSVFVSSTPPPQPSPLPSSLNWSQLYSVIQTSPHMINFSTATPGSIVSALLLIIFPIAGLVLLLMILYGGYNLMLSGGDPKRAQAAKSILTTALIGFIIIFIAFWLVNIIGRVLGVGDITSIFS